MEGGAAPPASSSAELRRLAEEHVPATSAGQAPGLQHSQAERQSGRAGTVSTYTCCIFRSMFKWLLMFTCPCPDPEMEDSVDC